MIPIPDTNNAGTWNTALACNSEQILTGLEVRDQSGYGLINAKILCGVYKVPGKCRDETYRLEYFVTNIKIHLTEDIFSPISNL